MDAPPEPPGGLLAYFLTFSTYGTRLHGDERGSVDRAHNAFGSPVLPSNSDRRDYERALLGGGPVVLSREMRAVVDAALRTTCRLRDWTILAVNVRTNHVHIVVSSSESPERTMTSLKAWSTTGLRKGGIVSPTARVWTRHGSTHYLWNENAVADACWYVEFGQDDKPPPR